MVVGIFYVQRPNMSHSGKYIMKYFNFDFGIFEIEKALKIRGIKTISKSRICGIFQKSTFDTVIA